jgi:Tol biopolymer transport system component
MLPPLFRLTFAIVVGVLALIIIVGSMGALQPDDDMLFYLVKLSQTSPAAVAMHDLTLNLVLNLTPGENILSFAPMPDGQHLLYIKQLAGAHAFYTMDLTTRESRFLMSDPTLAITPALSHDSTTMIYDNYSTRSLYRVDMWTLRSERLLYYGGVSLAFPDWSPDDSRIVMSAPHPDTNGIDLMLYDLADDRRIWLTDDLAQQSHPRFSPDGDSVVYRRVNGARHSIMVYDLLMNTTDVIYDDLSDLWGPDWSPDGSAIAFQVIRSGNSQLVLLDLATRHLTPVTGEVGWYSNPVWRP